MKKSDLAKTVFAIVALGTAAVIAFNVLFRASPQNEEMVDQLCLNPACGVEFQITLGEMKRLTKASEPVKCPKCGTVETNVGWRCGSCQKVNPPYGHGSPPPKCKFCKKPWVFADKPK